MYATRQAGIGSLIREERTSWNFIVRICFRCTAIKISVYIQKWTMVSNGILGDGQ